VSSWYRGASKAHDEQVAVGELATHALGLHPSVKILHGLVRLSDDSERLREDAFQLWAAKIHLQRSRDGFFVLQDALYSSKIGIS